jgi:hypothetical protein
LVWFGWVGWLVGLGWLVRSLGWVGWLVGCLVGLVWFVGWFSSLVGLSWVGLVSWFGLVRSFFRWVGVVGWLVGWLVGWFSLVGLVWLVGSVTIDSHYSQEYLTSFQQTMHTAERHALQARNYFACSRQVRTASRRPAV